MRSPGPPARLGTIIHGRPVAQIASITTVGTPRDSSVSRSYSARRGTSERASSRGSPASGGIAATLPDGALLSMMDFSRADHSISADVRVGRYTGEIANGIQLRFQ